jgi:hypothetical protein
MRRKGGKEGSQLEHRPPYQFLVLSPLSKMIVGFVMWASQNPKIQKCMDFGPIGPIGSIGPIGPDQPHRPLSAPIGSIGPYRPHRPLSAPIAPYRPYR